MWVIVPAAGAGRRLPGDAPKQYRRLAGRYLLDHCLDRLFADARVSGVMLCLAAADRHWPHSAYHRDARVATTTGGESRAESVLAGLAALTPRLAPGEELLVHDAARALLPAAALGRLLDARLDEHGGLLAWPVQDTVKHSEDGERVDATADRGRLWLAQTPQRFRHDRLQPALAAALAAGHAVTDEASAMERAGFQPRLVTGDARNFKITTPVDLELAAALLSSEEESCASA